MELLRKIKETIKNPKNILVFLNNRGIVVLPDEKYIPILYKIKTGKMLNLDSPKSYNEKLQWLKLNNRKDIYTTMVDKYKAKKYVADIIGEKYIIPTLGIYEKFDDICFDDLPNQFVMKCTHNSGGVVICKKKDSFNIKKARKTINKCMRRNFYLTSREWPYIGVQPKIIVEKYMEDKKYGELRDYKFFCFDGKIGIVLVCTNRQTDLEETWLDEDFNLIDLREGGHKNRTDLDKPTQFEQMKKIAKKLSVGIPHVRVDLYEINGKIYFGEMTFFPAGGFEQFDDEIWNEKLGKFISLEMDDRDKKAKAGRKR